jgi:hypothetical protein
MEYREPRTPPKRVTKRSSSIMGDKDLSAERRLSIQGSPR